VREEWPAWRPFLDIDQFNFTAIFQQNIHHLLGACGIHVTVVGHVLVVIAVVLNFGARVQEIAHQLDIDQEAGRYEGSEDVDCWVLFRVAGAEAAERGFEVYTESQERFERFDVVCTIGVCEHAPSSVPRTLCRVFPENEIQKLVELAVDLEKRVEVAVRVGVVLVARSIVTFFKVFADHVEELDGDDGESEVISSHLTHGSAVSSTTASRVPMKGCRIPLIQVSVGSGPTNSASSIPKLIFHRCYFHLALLIVFRTTAWNSTRGGRVPYACPNRWRTLHADGIQHSRTAPSVPVRLPKR
jgi:hypothetical protein